MRVIPVLDLKDGQAVHAIAGRRSEYKPVQSGLARSSCFRDVARAFRNELGFRELYLADLDAIAGRPPALKAYEAIRNLGLHLYVDAGVREVRCAVSLADAGVDAIILGLETLSGPKALGMICQKIDLQRLVFSLDLNEGVPLGDKLHWDQASPASIALQAIRIGIRSLIVIDLTRVGLGIGTGTEDLCRQLTHSQPDVEIIAGGGIRGMHDLLELKTCGVQAALVASALHDGRLRKQDLELL